MSRDWTKQVKRAERQLRENSMAIERYVPYPRQKSQSERSMRRMNRRVQV